MFSDGACEPTGSSIGAVIVLPSGAMFCFGAVVSQATADGWKSKQDQTQVVGQAELFPLLVARLTWPELLSSSRVLYFIDNESARSAMIRAYSPILSSLKIVQDCLQWDYNNESSGWYARVPTASNCGDEPSRMMVPFSGKGVEVVRPIFPVGHTPAVVLE